MKLMKHNYIKLQAIKVSVLFLALNLAACHSVPSSALNPFEKPPSPVALLGQPNDHALLGQGNKEDSARQALEAMATYQRAHAPGPANPVIQPAVVRLMWIPDHLNRNGDMVPAHYYYLRVLQDRWAVTDAFELEGQLHGPRGSAPSNIPFVYESSRSRR